MKCEGRTSVFCGATFAVAVLVLSACGQGRISSAQVTIPDLPMAVTNNAVAIDTTGGTVTLYSFLGLDSTKHHDGITRRAFRLTLGNDRWEELPPVPGPRGRLAATAQIIRGEVIVIGGYTVDSTGAERSVPEVDIWDPVAGRWRAAAPMPLPVDDAVSGVWRDSLLYLVSGWHDVDNVTAVQIYDPAADRWTMATPIPGAGVFGHAGGVVGDAILFVDGVTRNETRPRYRLKAQAWRGEIDPANPGNITWTTIPQHPGPPLYRAAAGVCGTRLVLAGGTDNPYNYDGVGYDGVPSDPRTGVVVYDVATSAWIESLPASVATMDHRGLLIGRNGMFVVGGMRSGQVVSAGTVILPRMVCSD